jgi:hypothetical protein
VGLVDIAGVMWLRRRIRLTSVEEVPGPTSSPAAGASTSQG